MPFLRRFLFYIIGIGLGVSLVFVFFGDRNFDYAYGPKARVKKNFRTKFVDSTTLMHPLLDMRLDSIYYHAVANGEIHLGASAPRKEPCGEYLYTFLHKGYTYKMILENCDTARVLSLDLD